MKVKTLGLAFVERFKHVCKFDYNHNYSSLNTIMLKHACKMK